MYPLPPVKKSTDLWCHSSAFATIIPLGWAEVSKRHSGNSARAHTHTGTQAQTKQGAEIEWTSRLGWIKYCVETTWERNFIYFVQPLSVTIVHLKLWDSFIQSVMMTPCRAVTSSLPSCLCLVSSVIKPGENALPPRCYWLPELPSYITFFFLHCRHCWAPFTGYCASTPRVLPLHLPLTAAPSPPRLHLPFLPHPVSLLTDFEGSSSSSTGPCPPPPANPDPLATPPASSPLIPAHSYPSFSFSLPPLHLSLPPSLSLRSSAGVFFHPPVPRVTPHELFTFGGEFLQRLLTVYCSNTDGHSDRKKRLPLTAQVSRAV